MATSSEPMTTITVRVPERVRDRFDALVRATDRNRQYHALEALHRYLEAEAWQIELISERLRQIDAGEVGYASPERIDAVLNKYRAYDEGQGG